MVYNDVIRSGEFARLASTTKNTLQHYENIGLLLPFFRTENNYRYYTYGQLAVVNMIRLLQDLGMSLQEIKTISEVRTPVNMLELFAREIKQVNTKIAEWENVRELLVMMKRNIEMALLVDENSIIIQHLPEEAIILGEMNDYKNGKNDYDALLHFHQHIKDKHPKVNPNSSACAMFSIKQLKQQEWNWPDRYFFYDSDGHDNRPASYYAIGYTRNRYGDNNIIFKRLLDYIDQNELEICGNAYMECPLNEICISDHANYLIRVMIMVREKGT